MTLKPSIDWKNEWFPIDDATYLNFAAHAAIPRVALNAVQRSVAAKMRPHVVDDQSFFSVAASLRQTLATLIGASPDEIALTTGAGAGLAAIAYALKWSAGDEVIIARGEFPVHYATWKPMEAREGIKVQIAVPQGPFIQSELQARQGHGRRPVGLEPEHGLASALDSPVVLLDDVVQVTAPTHQISTDSPRDGACADPND